MELKKLLLVSLFSGAFFASYAQSSVKKYALIEHFTNTKCGICANRNPAFYSLIGQPQYAADVHHISVHPSFPYSTCTFHLANPVDNSAWVAQYPDVVGTPRIAINGRLIPGSSQLLRQDTLNKYVGQTSPVEVLVTLTGSGSSRTALVKIKTVGQTPAGNYNLCAAAVEKTINLTTSNGESVHRDVFRDMLTPVTGVPVSLPATGQSSEFTYTFNLAPAWTPSEIYVLAYLRETTSKQVLNSGTNLDPQTSSSQEIPTQELVLSPNPAGETSRIALSADERIRSVLVFSADGSRANTPVSIQLNSAEISVKALQPGWYIVSVLTDKGRYSGKMVVENR
jgi:hypothetical protein